jgi:hypothetical protein
VTAIKRRGAYCLFAAAQIVSRLTGHAMIQDFHNLQPFVLCQLSKSAPNILWSVGSSVHNQFLQVGRVRLAVMAANISLRSFLQGHAGKTPGAAGITHHAMPASIPGPPANAAEINR